MPFFTTERKRGEQALMSLVKEAYVNGVSIRKVERLAKELGIEKWRHHYNQERPRSLPNDIPPAKVSSKKTLPDIQSNPTLEIRLNLGADHNLYIWKG